MGNGHESLQVDPSNIPDYQGVNGVDNEPVHLADGGPCHWAGHQDGGGREEEKDKSEKTIGQTKVNKEQAAWLPGLKKVRCHD